MKLVVSCPYKVIIVTVSDLLFHPSFGFDYVTTPLYRCFDLGFAFQELSIGIACLIIVL